MTDKNVLKAYHVVWPNSHIEVVYAHSMDVSNDTGTVTFYRGLVPIYTTNTKVILRAVEVGPARAKTLDEIADYARAREERLTHARDIRLRIVELEKEAARLENMK